MKLAAGVVAAILPFSLLAAEPKFSAAVDAEKYPSVAAPAEAPVFRWDFSAKRDYRFRIDEIVDSESALSGEPMTQKITGHGDLVVRTNGDGAAKLVLENLTVSTTPPPGSELKEMTNTMPTTVAGTIDPSGATSSQQPELQLLFTLPPAAFTPGQSIDVRSRCRSTLADRRSRSKG